MTLYTDDSRTEYLGPQLQYSGSIDDNNFPTEPILIEGDKFYLFFHSDFSAEDWGYALKVRVPGKARLDSRLEIMRSISLVAQNVAKYQPMFFYHSVASENMHGLKVLISALSRVDDNIVFDNIYAALLSMVSRPDILTELFSQLDQPHRRHHYGSVQIFAWLTNALSMLTSRRALEEGNYTVSFQSSHPPEEGFVMSAPLVCFFCLLECIIFILTLIC